LTAIYRLVRSARADDALSGEGARLYGGRWNPPGSAVVYASASRALAVLETFVHVTLEARTMSFVLYEIALPARPRVRRHDESLSVTRPRALASSRDIGRAWLEDGKTLALVVPSIVVPRETNYVLNVHHSQFAKLRVMAAEPFSFDERLWKS
jgi:RES domain-containing protein